MTESVRELLKLADYRRLLLAQMASELGDWLTNVALIVLLFRLTGYTGAAALVLIAKLLPRVLVYPIGGVLADWFDRRRLMIGADLLRAGLVASLVLVDRPEWVPWLLVVVLLTQALASIFNPAIAASLPAVVPAERLGAANSLIGSVKDISFILGPLLGTLLLLISDVWLAFLIDALTFAVSGLLVAGLPALPRPEQPRRSPARVTEDLAVGWATVRTDAGLLAAFTIRAGLGLLTATLNVSLVPLLLLLWQQAESQLGLLYGAVASGSLLGTFVVLRLTAVRYRSAGRLALGLAGLLALGLAWTPWFWLGLVVLAAIGAADSIGEVTAAAYLQAQVADDRRGRVLGLLFWTHAVGLVGGVVIGVIGSLTWSPVIVGLLGSCLVLVSWLLPSWLGSVARRPNEVPEATPPM